MAITERTFQILGEAYALSGNVTTVCTFDSDTVYNGVIPTVNSAIPDTMSVRGVLCSFPLGHFVFGVTKNLTMTVTGGTIFLAGIAMDNTDQSDLSLFRVLTSSTPGIKTNVMIDGILIDAVEPDDGWVYKIDDGETISIDWTIPTVDPATPGRGYNKGSVLASDAVNGTQYTIKTLGSTDFTLIGAATNTRDLVFTATGSGTGDGTVDPV